MSKVEIIPIQRTPYVTLYDPIFEEDKYFKALIAVIKAKFAGDPNKVEEAEEALGDTETILESMLGRDSRGYGYPF